MQDHDRAGLTPGSKHNAATSSLNRVFAAFYRLHSCETIPAYDRASKTKGSTFEIHTVRPLFQPEVRTLGGNPTMFPVMACASSSIASPPAEQNPAPISLVSNWTAGLRH